MKHFIDNNKKIYIAKPLGNHKVFWANLKTILKIKREKKIHNINKEKIRVKMQNIIDMIKRNETPIIRINEKRNTTEQNKYH